MRMYELTEQYAAILDLLDSCTPEEEPALLEELTGLNDSIAEKAEAYARIMKNDEAEIAALKAEIGRLQALKARREKRVERMRDRLKECMKTVGASSIGTSIGKWTLRSNAPSVVVLNADEVPEEYRIPQPFQVDKKAIKAAFSETGEIPPGCDIVRTEGVQFR